MHELTSARSKLNISLDVVELRNRQTSEQRDALSEGLSKADFTVHSGLCDTLDMLLCVDEGGEFIDGFLADESGIEIEDCEAFGFAGNGDGLQDDIHVLKTAEMEERGAECREMD